MFTADIGNRLVYNVIYKGDKKKIRYTEENDRFFLVYCFKRFLNAFFLFENMSGMNRTKSIWGQPYITLTMHALIKTLRPNLC